MEKKILIGVILIIVLLVVGIQFLDINTNKDQPSDNNAQAIQPVAGQNPTIPTPVDKIEVFHFHATQQCVSCIAIGKYTEEVINDKFSKEVKDGKIVFKSLNIDLPENTQIAQDYRVSGSSLQINAIKDNISYKQEDLTVWRIVNNEAELKSYFEDKLNSLLGK